MQFKSIGTVELKEFEDPWSNEAMEFNDKIEELEKQCDIIRVFTHDGKNRLLAKNNFQFGQCGCCSGLSRSDIAIYQFFKLL